MNRAGYNSVYNLARNTIGNPQKPQGDVTCTYERT